MLDANVLYPMWTRDILLWLAQHELFMPKWSQKIMDEWVHALSNRRPDIDPQKIDHTIAMMNEAFEDALVDDSYQVSVDGLELPDPDDCHVLAAAIHSGAQIIVTSNLKDFPREYLAKFNIEALHPDEFIRLQFGQDLMKTMGAFKALKESKKKPAISYHDLIESCEKAGLPLTAEELTRYADLFQNCG